MFSISKGMANVHCHLQSVWHSFILSYGRHLSIPLNMVSALTVITNKLPLQHEIYLVIPDLCMLDTGCVTF